MKKIIFVSAILFSAILFGTNAFASNPSIKLKWYLEKNRCDQVVRIFNGSVAGTSEEEKYVEMLLNYIEETKTSWMNEEKHYREAVIQLEALRGVNQKKVSSEAKYMASYIEREGFGNECYKKAESYIGEDDFINAMKELHKIHKDYLGYADVLKLNNLCKEIILKETENLESVKEIEKSIHKMEEYFAMVPEPAFATRKAQLEKELESLKEIIELVKDASDAYNAQKYKEAFVILEGGLEKYPDNLKMKEGYFLYLEQYVEMIAKEAQEACDNKEYKKAKFIVEEALEVHDCEPLRLILEHVKEERSILYRWKNDFLEFIEKFK